MQVHFSRLAMALACAAALALSTVVASAQGGSDIAVTISPVGGSGVSAIANLTAAGNQTSVSVSLTGLTPGSTNETEIHFGTCANTGNIAFSFPNVVANAAGNASLTTTVNATLVSLQDGNHLIHTHLASAAGAVLACGDIPVAAVAATATPVATAVGAATAVAAATATPANLPATGDPGLPLVPVVLLSLGAIGIGFFARRPSRN